MTSEQRAAAEEMSAGPRGAVIGPFIPMLRSPELTRRVQRVGEYLRYQPALPPALREMAILLTAREWTQNFEWDVHAPLAAREGLTQEVIQAIADGRRPERMHEREAIVCDVFTELHRTRSVSDATYAAAVAALGEQGVVDLVALIGYYSLLAMIMNTARTPLPEGRAPTLQAFPR